MTQTLYLLRHAKSVPWYPGVNDFGRRVAERGHAHMQRLSAWMLEHLEPPGQVLCSTSRRTRETLSPVLAAWPQCAANTRYLDEIYEASTGTLHALAAEAFRSADSVLMVGHNPGFESLALLALRDADAAEITKMPTGALAVIDFPGGYEKDCGRGVLRQWVGRKEVI